MTIKRVGPLSCARIAGVIYAAIGFVIGIFVCIFAVLGAALAGMQRGGVADKTFSPMIAAAMGIGAIFMCPIVYGAIGFLSALIGAWLYNLIASRVGGIEIEIS